MEWMNNSTIPQLIYRCKFKTCFWEVLEKTFKKHFKIEVYNTK